MLCIINIIVKSDDSLSSFLLIQVCFGEDHGSCSIQFLWCELSQILVNTGSCSTLTTSRCWLLTGKGAALHPQWELSMALLGTLYILDVQAFIESLLCIWQCSNCYQVLTPKTLWRNTAVTSTISTVTPYYSWIYVAVSKSIFHTNTPPSGFPSPQQKPPFFFPAVTFIFVWKTKLFNIYLFSISPLQFILMIYLLTVSYMWQYYVLGKQHTLSPS